MVAAQKDALNRRPRSRGDGPIQRVVGAQKERDVLVRSVDVNLNGAVVVYGSVNTDNVQFPFSDGVERGAEDNRTTEEDSTNARGMHIRGRVCEKTSTTAMGRNAVSRELFGCDALLRRRAELVRLSGAKRGDASGPSFHRLIEL